MNSPKIPPEATVTAVEPVMPLQVPVEPSKSLHAIMTPREESWILFLMASVQFINALDFMMVMPLGPDFAQALAIPKAHLGYIGGSYTAAAAVAGVVGSFFLDKFDRKRALLCCLVGLGIATVLGGFATGLASLMLARVLAGIFGGPASALTLSVVADLIPPERRGKALGIVFGAFSIASVFGVPIGLELARLGGWYLPFFAVGGVCFAVIGLVTWKLPTLKGHLRHASAVRHSVFLRKLVQPRYFMAVVVTLFVVTGIFTIIPNFSAYLQFNAHYPRERLGLLYLVGGALAFFAVRFAGHWTDRFGPTRVIGLVSLFLCADLFFGFAFGSPELPVMLMFIGFMIPQAIRNVAVNTLLSKVPRPEERARFQSQQSATQHLAATAGSFLGSVVLSEAPTGELIGIPKLAIFAIVMTLCVPIASGWIERHTEKNAF